MDKKLISTLQNMNNKINFTCDELIRLLNIKGDNELKKFKRCLTRLISSGSLYYNYNDDTYMLFSNSNMHKGILKLDNKKRYYLVEDDSRYFVSSLNLHHASYGDYVIIGYNMKNHCYEVNKILEKDGNKYVALIVCDKGNFYAYDSKFGNLEIINKDDGLIEGSMVLIEKISDQAKILEVICHKDDADASILRVVYEHGFTNEISAKERVELDSIPDSLSDEDVREAISSGVIDLRNLNLVTIDCDSTKDIDDGVCVHMNDDGTFSLYVCIADVSRYVKDGSALAVRVKDAGTSVYPGGCVVPMLPRKLSNGICSLNPGVYRYAICFKSLFNGNGDLISFDIFRSVIKSRKKMSYGMVDKVLENGNCISEYKDYYKQLLMLERLYLLIKNNFYNNGLLEFKNLEFEFDFDDSGKVIGLKKGVEGVSANIIEFLMLVTNKNACEYFSKLGIPLIYRVDEEPNYKKISEILDMLQKLNYLGNSISAYDDDGILKTRYTKEELQTIIRGLDNVFMPEVFHQMFIRTMSKARFSVNNIGHYPLGMSYYAQFTSPIRRGGDWRNHTIIDYYLNSGKDVNMTRRRFPINSLMKEAIVYSDREREADIVSSEVNQMLLLNFLNENISYMRDITFMGRVSCIGNSVRVLIDYGISGKLDIPMEKYDICGNDLVCDNNIVCSVGDLVCVNISGVNLNTKEILLSLERNLEKEYNNGKEKSEKKVKVRKYISNS